MPLAFTIPEPYQSGFRMFTGEKEDNVRLMAQSRLSVSQPIPVTATANTDYSFTLPTGCVVISIDVYTSVAYTGSGGVTVAAGSAQGGAQYVAATSIASLGLVKGTFVGAGIANLINMPAGPNNLWIRIAQAGTATAVGNGLVLVTYSIQ